MSILSCRGNPPRVFRRRTSSSSTCSAKSSSRALPRNNSRALLRILQKAFARPVELATFARGQTSDAEFRDLVENGIDRDGDVLRFGDAPRGGRFLDNAKPRFLAEGIEPLK